METNNFSRRSFVKTSSAITASILIAPHIARAVENDKVLKIGLVGIGGRGSGAAAQAMNADDNVALTAMEVVEQVKLSKIFEGSRKNCRK